MKINCVQRSTVDPGRIKKNLSRMPSGLFVLIIAQATSARHDIAITTPGCVDAAIADYPDGPIVVDGSVTVSKLFSLFHLFSPHPLFFRSL